RISQPALSLRWTGSPRNFAWPFHTQNQCCPAEPQPCQDLHEEYPNSETIQRRKSLERWPPCLAGSKGNEQRNLQARWKDLTLRWRELDSNHRYPEDKVPL